MSYILCHKSIKPNLHLWIVNEEQKLRGNYEIGNRCCQISPEHRSIVFVTDVIHLFFGKKSQTIQICQPIWLISRLTSVLQSHQINWHLWPLVYCIFNLFCWNNSKATHGIFSLLTDYGDLWLSPVSIGIDASWGLWSIVAKRSRSQCQMKAFLKA